MRRWADLTDDERHVVLGWVIGTVLLWGGSRQTAYTVAGVFAGGLDRELEAT